MDNQTFLSFNPASASLGAVGLQDFTQGNIRELATKLGYNYLAHYIAGVSGVSDMILSTAEGVLPGQAGEILGATALGVSGDIVAGQLRQMLGFSF